MYDITEENLKWAYKKFKNYIYYDNSSLMYKRLICDFEKKYTNETFSIMAKNLKEKIKNDKPLSNFGINISVLPKKDGIIEKNNLIVVEKYNFFIYMPIELFLVDILFTMNLFKIYKKDTFKFSYGNVFDEKMYDIPSCDDVLKNKLLFSNYMIKYKEYNREIFDYIKNNNQKDLILFKLDIEKCFYNINVNIVDFIDNFDFIDNDVFKYVKNIYLYYKEIVCKNIIDLQLEKKYSLLPIGLFSSRVLLNIFLKDMDYYIANNSLRYCRYVDDMLILVEKKDGKNNIDDYLENVFYKEVDSYYINRDIMKYGSLKINNNKYKKIIYKNNTSISSFERKFKKISKPSIIENDLNNFFDEYDSCQIVYKGIERIIKKCKHNDGIDQKVEFTNLINTLDCKDYINIFPLWGDLIQLANNNQQKVIDNIEYAINQIVIEFDNIKNNSLTDNIKKQLRNELNIYRNNNNKSLIYGVDLRDTFNFIEKKNYDIDIEYPICVSFDEVCLYLSSRCFIKTNFFEEACNIFYKINNYNCDCCLEVLENESVYKIMNKKMPSKKEDSTFVAVVSLNMKDDNFKCNEIKGIYNKNYKINTIKHLIRTASHKGADYILFPELSIPFNDSYEIVKYCKENKISIIIGLSHYVFEGKIFNFVLIRDNNIDLTILKAKNYLSYDEKHIETYKPGEPEQPYYLIIDSINFVYTVMLCYEITSIKDRALLTDKVEFIFVPVFNKDTNYFSSIISSFATDSKCFIAQANSSEFGDSRITGPYNTNNKDIIKLKGGENNYYVIGKVDLKDLEYEEKKDNNVGEKRIKPLMAGKDRKNNRKNNGIR